MTHQELNRLFAEARTAPAQTTVEEVTAWVGTAAAAGAGVLGIAAKLKLLIAKKSLLMLGSVLGAAGITVVGVTMFGASPEAEKNASITPVNIETREIEHVPVVFQQDDTLEVNLSETPEPEVVVPVPPVSPVAPAPPTVVIAPRIMETMLLEVEPPIIAMAPLKVEPSRPAGVAPVIFCDDGKRKTVEGSGKVISEDREVKPFKEMEVTGIFDVFITQGDHESVRVEADDNLVQYIVTENKGEVLSISSDCKVNIKKPTKMIVHVTVKSLSRVDVQGIGDVKSKNALQGKKFIMDVSGVGDVALEVNYSSIEMDYNGVGNITLKGKVDKISLDCSGVGDVDTYELVAREVNLDQSGVGDTKVYAQETIDIDFSGVGDVHYKGDPQHKNIQKDGIGSVKSR